MTTHQLSGVTTHGSPLTPDLTGTLAILRDAKLSGDIWLSSVEISTRFRSLHGVNLHWRTVQKMLLDSPTLVARRKRDNRWQFSIMKAGEEHLSPTGPGIVVVDPSNAVQAVSSLHSFLNSLSGIVSICDPWLDATTIEHLDACNPSSELKLLTVTVKDSGPLRRLASAFNQNRKLSVRISSSPQLHDRYIIDDEEMMILGSSLNGFGKKQCFIVKAGPDFRSTMLSAFELLWQTSTPWP